MGVGGGMIRCNRFFEKNASELEYGLQDAKVATGELAFLRGICAVFKKPRQCPKLRQLLFMSEAFGASSKLKMAKKSAFFLHISNICSTFAH